MIDLAYNLRQLKERTGLSLKHVAEQTGMKQNTVSNWFRGVRQPRIEMLPKIAQIYGITVDELLKESDELHEYKLKCNQDISGQRFGRLTAVKHSSGARSKTKWLCKCECGNEIEVLLHSLTSGNTRSCGCLLKEPKGTNAVRHSGRLYRIWKAMRTRTSNPKVPHWNCYGGRGISVCEEWGDYEVFREWALSNGYNDSLSIDRIDTDKSYSPDNCRWADTFTQMNNTRRNHYLTYDCETHTIAEWSRILGINRTTLNSRINRGLSAQEAIDKGIEDL